MRDCALLVAAFALVPVVQYINTTLYIIAYLVFSFSQFTGCCLSIVSASHVHGIISMLSWSWSAFNPVHRNRLGSTGHCAMAKAPPLRRTQAPPSKNTKIMITFPKPLGLKHQHSSSPTLHRNSITGTQISSSRTDNLTWLYSIQKSIHKQSSRTGVADRLETRGHDRERAKTGK